MNIDQLVLYQDKDLIVVNKPPTWPCLPDKTGDISLLDRMQDKCNRELYPINRLDRPVSGIQLFANSASGQAMIEQMEIKKQYIAITHKSERLTNGLIANYHAKNGKSKKAIISIEPKKGFKPIKLTILHLQELNNYFALMIELGTGRFHQIRAQLAHLGAPIKGDVKYGARRKNRDRSIYLHSYRLTILEKKLKIECPPPQDALWQLANNCFTT